MKQHEVPTLDRDIPELPTRYLHTPDTPDFDDLTFSEADKYKLDRAAQRGPTSVKMALAGDAEAMADLKRLHLTFWKDMF